MDKFLATKNVLKRIGLEEEEEEEDRRGASESPAFAEIRKD